MPRKLCASNSLRGRVPPWRRFNVTVGSESDLSIGQVRGIRANESRTRPPCVDGHPDKSPSKLVFVVAIGVVLTVLLGAVSVGSVVTSSVSAHSAVTLSATQVPRLISSCLSNEYGTLAAVFNPSNGYVYVADGYSGVVVVKPPCTFVKSIPALVNRSEGFAFVTGVSYDPLTHEVVAVSPTTEESAGLTYVWVIHGTTLAKKVDLGDSQFAFSAAWDPALLAFLIPNSCCTYSSGVDILYVTEVNGTTRVAVILNAFDRGNLPQRVFVADRYVFAMGNRVDTFSDRTLNYLGSFDLSAAPGCGGCVSMAWDPLNHTVLVGLMATSPSKAVYFLDANSVASRTFTFRSLPIHDILKNGAGGVAFSPADNDVYITAAGGSDVWFLSTSGLLQHIYLGTSAGLGGLAYDPVSHDMYVCGSDLYGVGGLLYVLSP